MTTNWQFKVVKSQRGMDGKWFHYRAAATFAEEAEARQYAKQWADGDRSPGTRILVISRREIEGPIGPTHSVAEYR